MSKKRFIAKWTTNPDHLEKMSGDGSWDIRSSVAKNILAPQHILEKLSGDEYRGVRYRVAKHPSTPPHILEKLSGDEYRGVRRTTSEILENKHV